MTDLLINIVLLVLLTSITAETDLTFLLFSVPWIAQLGGGVTSKYKSASASLEGTTY
jgi:hypothetical protein